MTELMAKVSTFTRMGQLTKVTGSKTSKMDTELKFNQMDPGMKAPMYKGRNKGRVSFNGRMDLCTKANLKIIIYMEKECIHG